MKTTESAIRTLETTESAITDHYDNDFRTDITKRCPRCQTTKDATAFYRSSSAATGLASYCRECSREASREWRAGNRAETIAARDARVARRAAAEARLLAEIRYDGPPVPAPIYGPRQFHSETCSRGHKDWGSRPDGRRYCAECQRQRARIQYHDKTAARLRLGLTEDEYVREYGQGAPGFRAAGIIPTIDPARVS